MFKIFAYFIENFVLRSNNSFMDRFRKFSFILSSYKVELITIIGRRSHTSRHLEFLFLKINWSPLRIVRDNSLVLCKVNQIVAVCYVRFTR